MKKKKGFTLVELLAVIVILAVILIIAVPRISEVINNSKKASFEATAKTIANQAEKKYMENEVLGKTGSLKCRDVVKLNNTDYASCTITFDESGNALVSITGSGKFAGLIINNATKNSATATELTETAAKYFSYEVEKNVEVIDQSKCVAYYKNTGETEEAAAKLCNGEVVDGATLLGDVKESYISALDYETAGLKVTNGPNIVITGYSALGGLDVVIPSMIDGKKVVAIADYAFTVGGVIPEGISNTSNNYQIKKLNYNDSNNYVVKRIVTDRIYGLGIKSVVIPNTVKRIGNCAFEGNKLTNVVIPPSVTLIDDSAFYNNQLTSIVIPPSVTSIGEDAFANNQIKSITFPTTPITITDSTFYDNPITNSETYTYPDNVIVK